MNYYPEGPKNIPTEISKIPISYAARVLLVLLAIIAFIFIYSAMLAGSAYLVYISIIYNVVKITKLTLLLKIGSIATSVMLFLFIIKFIFKQHRQDNSMMIELKEKDYPELFSFIRILAQDVGAPFPKKIFASPDVNAAVFYNSSILSLFLPVRKNLLIGLSLVNSLNLSEFKAVLAHEFGHFSQSSMKLGNYVYVANKILHTMVYDRDKWDNILNKWCNQELRIAIFGWILKGIVTPLRAFLSFFYGFINRLNSSLSRQMEFNADLEAVKITGSEAIINALYKLKLANEAFSFVASHLYQASHHDLFTDDFLYHHSWAKTFLMKQKKIASEIPEIPFDAFLFNDEKDVAVGMYAHHPSDYDRERNAKKNYIKGNIDERSPWILFGNSASLRKEMSKRMYDGYEGIKIEGQMQPAEKVQEFIADEVSETTYNEKYRGIYDERFITEFTSEELEVIHAMNPKTNETLRKEFDDLYGTEFTKRIDLLEVKKANRNRLGDFLAGNLTLKSIEIEGVSFHGENAKNKFDAISQEIEDDCSWLKDFDKKVYELHYLTALNRGNDSICEFRKRYEFHFKIQEMLRYLIVSEDRLNQLFNKLRTIEEIDQDTLNNLRKEFSTIRQALFVVLENSKLIENIPQFKNLEKISSFQHFILSEPLIEKIPNDTISRDWLKLLAKQLSLMLLKVKRVYFKSIGGILAFQENLAEPQKRNS